VDYLCSAPKASGGKILKFCALATNLITIKFAREAKTNLRKDRILNRREHKFKSRRRIERGAVINLEQLAHRHG